MMPVLTVNMHSQPLYLGNIAAETISRSIFNSGFDLKTKWVKEEMCWGHKERRNLLKQYKKFV